EFAADYLGHSNTALNSPRGTEVQVKNLPIKADKLLPNGVQKTGGFQNGVLLLRGELHQLIFSEVVVRGQHTQQQEDDGDSKQDGNQRLKQPLDGVFKHQTPLLAS